MLGFAQFCLVKAVNVLKIQSKLWQIQPVAASVHGCLFRRSTHPSWTLIATVSTDGPSAGPPTHHDLCPQMSLPPIHPHILMCPQMSLPPIHPPIMSCVHRCLFRRSTHPQWSLIDTLCPHMSHPPIMIFDTLCPQMSLPPIHPTIIICVYRCLFRRSTHPSWSLIGTLSTDGSSAIHPPIMSHRCLFHRSTHPSWSVSTDVSSADPPTHHGLWLTLCVHRCIFHHSTHPSWAWIYTVHRCLFRWSTHPSWSLIGTVCPQMAPPPIHPPIIIPSWHSDLAVALICTLTSNISLKTSWQHLLNCHNVQTTLFFSDK